MSPGDRGTLPVRHPAELGISVDQHGVTAETDRFEPDPAVHGVVLAAGQSERYGSENKLLQPLAGDPLVVHAVRTAVAAPLDGVTVVLGYEAHIVRETIESAAGDWSGAGDTAIDFRQNDAFREGQSTSLACGVAAAAEREADAVLVLLGDMPDVSVETVGLLVDSYARTTHDALAAAFDGARGNPVLFDSLHFDALRDVEGDTGGREILLETADAIAVETGDPGVLRDVDRPSER